MILITQNDFTSRTGIDLSQELRDSNSSSGELANNSIERWTKYVYKVARMMGSYIDKIELTDFQTESLKDAICNYGAFCLLHGDYEALKGDINPTPDIISTLKQCGLIRNGFKGR